MISAGEKPHLNLIVRLSELQRSLIYSSQSKTGCQDKTSVLQRAGEKTHTGLVSCDIYDVCEYSVVLITQGKLFQTKA